MYTTLVQLLVTNSHVPQPYKVLALTIVLVMCILTIIFMSSMHALSWLKVAWCTLGHSDFLQVKYN